MEVVDWVLESSPFDRMTATLSGPPEWPGFEDSEAPLGMLRQPNRIVEAVSLVRTGYAQVMGRRNRAAAEKNTPALRRATRDSARKGSR